MNIHDSCIRYSLLQPIVLSRKYGIPKADLISAVYHVAFNVQAIRTAVHGHWAASYWIIVAGRIQAKAIGALVQRRIGAGIESEHTWIKIVYAI